jgi:hypothetical protein
MYRLAGTKGASAVVGEALKVQDDNVVCWKLHPAYAAWFWPLMAKVVDLVILVPLAEMEAVDAGDSTLPPVPPTEAQKTTILKMPDLPADSARVYTLALKGKQALVHKAFPTRVANLEILRSCRRLN